jgi:uncharacterized protein (TIGR02996 family)
MSPEDAFLEDIRARPEDRTPKLIFADWLEEHGQPDLAYAYRWMASRGYRPGQRLRRLARKPWAWWNEHTLEGPEGVDPADRPDIERCPHAVLPVLVFRAIGGELRSGPHAYYSTYAECVRGLAGALKWLRELTALKAPGS